MTPGQRALWFAQSLDPASSGLQCAELITFSEGLDPDLFVTALGACLDLLPPLRCSFGPDSTGTPSVLIDAPSGSKAQPITRGMLGADEACDLVEWASQKISQVAGMDAATSSIRGEALHGHDLMECPDGTLVWLARFHHILADGFAINSFVTWVGRTYGELAQGTTEDPAEVAARLNPLSLPDPNGARESTAEDREYWTDPAREIAAHPPTLMAGATSAAARPIQATTRLSAQMRKGLRTLALSAKCIELDVLTAVCAHYTAAMNSAEKVTIGLPLMNRTLGSKTVAFEPRVNVLPLVLPGAVNTEESAADVIAHARDQLRELRAHDSVRGEELRRLLGVTDPQAQFTGPSVNLRPFSPVFKFGEVKASLRTISVGLVHDVELIFQSEMDGSFLLQGLAHGTAEQQPALARHLERIAQLLEGVAQGKPLSELPLCTPEDHDLILGRFNATEHAVNHATLQSAVRACREETYESTEPALWFDDQWIDRATLWGQVDAVAAQLQAHGAGLGTLVGIELPRSPAASIATAACALIGCAWLPVDPELPQARRDYMYEVAHPVLIVGSGKGADFELDAHSLTPAASASELGELDEARPEDPAYVLFTSGSTGKPKGVEVPQGAIANRLEWMAADIGLGARDVIMHKTHSSFDVSVWEFLLPFTHGCAKAVATPNAHRDPERLAAEMAQAKATVCHFVPSALKAFLAWHNATGAQTLEALRHVILSGEALPADLARRGMDALDAELHNYYGPTEAAIDVTVYTVRGDEDVIPIGAPVWNTRCYVRDAAGRLLPPGGTGKLWLAGIQVATGYLGRPELTAERFLPDPYVLGERMYDSGDLARWRSDGNLDYLGRTDAQVKLRGQRLEPAEIEDALAADACVAQVAVGVRDEQLIAWVVGSEIEPEALRERAARVLPAYMVPSFVVLIDALPQTTSGKLDTRALPVPEVTRAEVMPVQGANEERVAEAFAEVLGLEAAGGVSDSQASVGRDSHFFELGGTSLSAVELSIALGGEVGVSDIFAAPTVAALAALLEAAEAPGEGGLAPFVELRAHEAGIPVYCLYPAGGLSWSYTPLARMLSRGRGIYLAQAPGLIPGQVQARSIEEAARLVVADIRGRSFEQVDLVGWSVGGVLAQEVAALEPERVRKLCLLDAYPAELWKNHPAPTRAELLQGVLTMAGQDVTDAEKLDKSQVIKALHDAGGAFGSLSEKTLGTITELIGHNAAIMRAHTTKPWPGRAHFFHAERNPEHMDPHAWDPFLGGLTITGIDVTHPGLVAHDSLRLVADTLNQ